MRTDKLAYGIDEACEASGHGRTKLYEAIKEGKLKARKAGSRTVVLHDELRDYLGSLPLVREE